MSGRGHRPKPYPPRPSPTGGSKKRQSLTVSMSGVPDRADGPRPDADAGASRWPGRSAGRRFSRRSADPVFVLDRRHRLLFVNAAWEKLTGIPVGRGAPARLPSPAPGQPRRLAASRRRTCADAAARGPPRGDGARAPAVARPRAGPPLVGRGVLSAAPAGRDGRRADPRPHHAGRRRGTRPPPRRCRNGSSPCASG